MAHKSNGGSEVFLDHQKKEELTPPVPLVTFDTKGVVLYRPRYHLPSRFVQCKTLFNRAMAPGQQTSSLLLDSRAAGPQSPTTEGGHGSNGLSSSAEVTDGSGSDVDDQCAVSESVPQSNLLCQPVQLKLPGQREKDFNNSGGQGPQSFDGRADPVVEPKNPGNSNLSDVVMKAKKAASSLFLILHAQTCRNIKCSSIRGCLETKKVLLHIKQVSSHRE